MSDFKGSCKVLKNLNIIIKELPLFNKSSSEMQPAKNFLVQLNSLRT